MRGRDFLRVAKKMERLSRDMPKKEREALLRKAISAIYYGVLWEIIEFLENEGGSVVGSYKVHQTIRMSLKAKGYEEASDRLQSLHALRKIADYDRSSHVTHKDFTTAELYAKLILAEVGL